MIYRGETMAAVFSVQLLGVVRMENVWLSLLVSVLLIGLDKAPKRWLDTQIKRG
jgi:hypothetical protein